MTPGKPYVVYTDGGEQGEYPDFTAAMVRVEELRAEGYQSTRVVNYDRCDGEYFSDGSSSFHNGLTEEQSDLLGDE